jgi:hypothetical protein
MIYNLITEIYLLMGTCGSDINEEGEEIFNGLESQLDLLE